jgi:CheY-like chemotaxis protein
MEARKFWNVLIVDDEPDIHEISELSLKRETVFGAKLKLHHAKSAKEARDFFEYDDAAAALAVAFIDVVMETDDAGLQLCKYIREERGEHVTQLILRTGQPGKAPPRQIIDDHNVSGYMTKIEATPDRLYMVLKTAIQQYYNLQYLFWSSQVYDTARRYCKTPAELFKQASLMMQEAPPDALGFQFHRAMDFGKHYIGQGAFKERQAYEAIKEDLLKRGREGLARHGIALVDNHVIVQCQVVGTDKMATMVVKDASYPRGLHELYGSVWRQKLAYLAEVFHRIP